MSSQTGNIFAILCPNCLQSVQVTRAHIGKKGRCPTCQTVFPIQPPDTSAPRFQDSLSSPPNDPLAAGELHSGSAMFSDAAYSTRPVQAASFSAVPASPSHQHETQPYGEPFKRTSLTDDYLARARNDRGGTIEQEEQDPQYRFFTSWGSVIGGLSTLGFSILFLLPLFLYFFSFRGVAFAIVLAIAGGGWFLQGLNYVLYYKWKDGGGRG